LVIVAHVRRSSVPLSLRERARVRAGCPALALLTLCDGVAGVVDRKGTKNNFRICCAIGERHT
jgi:hypothetical protein